MNSTPNASRLHIAIYGRRNSGKSSLINAIAQQDVALVSPVAGTTTDIVSKSMELHGIGACLFTDTPGFDDHGEVGEGRVERTLRNVERTNIAMLLCEDGDLSLEKSWCERLRTQNIAIIAIINKIDAREDIATLRTKIEQQLKLTPLCISAKEGVDIEVIRQSILDVLPADLTEHTITGNLVTRGDSVLLVMPQDPQAPKGRLILPQVQTMRELLDKECIISSCTTALLPATLAALKNPPKLIITDSQAFARVAELCPAESLLTSFSILMAGYKGDIKAFKEGATAIDRLTPTSRVLIAEACTHAPMSEDIGRVKLPRMLRSRIGESLHIDIVAGREFPSDLATYDLIIHCGGCMFNRKYLLWRIKCAMEQGVPITNYGVAIAHISGVLEQVTISD